MSLIAFKPSLNELNDRFAHSEPVDLLRWAADLWSGQVKLACSFGAEDMALLHIVATEGLPIEVFVLDTGRLHEETYTLWERARSRYRIEITAYTPESGVLQELVRQKGPRSFYESIENRKECCFVRKVEPLGRALKDAKGWVTGLRQEQSSTRTGLQLIDEDADHGGILKLNPLARWTEGQVWDFIRTNQIPYNPLHDRGFPSIGCAPCTRAVKPGEDIRAGRWWWESPEHRECGLHLRQAK